MTPDSITFHPFRIDPHGGRLLRDGQTIPLRPKTWAVLLYLAQRQGVLITKDELLDNLWPGIAVTPDTLTKSIGELRLALGDDAKTPHFIETVHRRGFRFIAEIQVPRSEVPGSGSLVSGHSGDEPGTRNQEPENRFFVGREPELERLEGLLRQAHQGERRVVFVTGSAGVGKTTLVETFLESAAVHGAAATIWVGRGASIEQRGAREPYMPVLEALGRLARRPDAAKVTALLQSTAPSWLAQMPWLISNAAHDGQQAAQAAKPDRMLREFAALTEALTDEVTLVLVLEDLHWSDPSTVDLLSMLAQRHERARLLIIGTYRPAELVVQEHPLSSVTHMLRARRRSVELPLHELKAGDVQRYLEARFPGAQFPPALAPLIHDHTDGNPLFLAAVVDHMLSRGLILDTAPGWALRAPLERIELGVPDDIGQMVNAQVEMLSPVDRELLEVASVGGIEVAVPALAAVLESNAATVEMLCERLARSRRFLRSAGSTEWPDGTVTRRYAFVHELYRQVLHAGIPDQQRMRLHQHMGEALETAYGERAAEIAPTLALHFERSRDYLRAIPYLTIAGARARQRCANREALAYLQPALAAVAALPQGALCRRLELGVRLVLGAVLADLHGYAAEQVDQNYERANALCSRAANPADLFEIVYALCHFHAAHGNTDTDALAKRLDALANRVGTADARLRADSALVRIALVGGRFRQAIAHMQRMISSDSSPHLDRPPDFGPDPRIDAHSHYALALWFVGEVERARAVAQNSIAAARAGASLLTHAAALTLGGVTEVFCGNADSALLLADEAAELCRQQNFAYWLPIASAVKGQADVLLGRTQAGLDQLMEARRALQATGTRIFSTHILAFLADAHRRNGTLTEALAAADAGLAVAESSLDRTYLPELWRLKGEILLAAATPHQERRQANRHYAPAEAKWRDGERCLTRALELAHASRAKSLELRAATSLAHARHARGRSTEARTLLAPICEWFPSDCSSPDLVEARTLLNNLSSSVRVPRTGRQPAPIQSGRGL